MRPYQQISSLLAAIENCKRSNNQEWIGRHMDKLEQLLLETLPHGAGFDAGTTLDGRSTPERLIFNTSFHHINENGFYTGWTEHQVIITPSLQFGFNMRITGKDKNQIKEYIADVLQAALDQ